MPRRSGRKRRSSDNVDDAAPMITSSSSSPPAPITSSSGSQQTIDFDHDDDNNDDGSGVTFQNNNENNNNNNNKNNKSNNNNNNANTMMMMFSQQEPEPTQHILPVKPSEKCNLDNMTPEAREKILMDLSRLVLFKAFSGEPIDRLKCYKEAVELGNAASNNENNNNGVGGQQRPHIEQERISSAAFEEVANRLSNVFGFELKRYPKWMERIKKIPAKFKDRYYVVNGTIVDDASGLHSKAIHSVHTDSAIQKGFLMIVLSFIYCKGEARGDTSRWITDIDLYRLLHQLDDNIPSEPLPPSSKGGGGGGRNRTSSMTTTSTQSSSNSSFYTPDVDALLEQFVAMDYLMKEKITDEMAQNLAATSSTQAMEDAGFMYSMGPRAAIEVGRRQIIYFCAEILDEEPDPTMLMELEDDDDEEVDEGEGEAGGGIETEPVQG